MSELSPSLSIDTARLLDELHALAGFSVCPEPVPAVTRVVFTDQDRAARAWFRRLFGEAGLAVREDPIGNTFARWCPEGCDAGAPAVGSGSHIDAIPHAGMYDGTVGVLGALEAVRALQRAGAAPKRPIDVILFTSEEPTRFGLGCTGSRAMCGALAPEALRALTDEQGVTLDQARAEAGFTGDLADVALPADAYGAFVELHIEQGPTLEADGIDLGVVTAIAAPSAARFVIEGEGGHAGGVLMPTRKDALCAAAELALRFEHHAKSSPSPDCVATAGEMAVHPGAVNSIPSRVELSLDLRDIDLANRDAVLASILADAGEIAGRRGVRIGHDVLNADPPAHCDGVIQDALDRAASAGGYTRRRMVSRAYHDSLFMATRFPTGMLFVPCRDGVSHRPDEFVEPQHLTAGVETLARALADLAGAPLT
ncbi:MAG: M20 family metallo-hydrolase [Planctomycetota bacterium]